MLELVRVNKLRSCYIRPLVLRAYGEMGVNPLKNPLEVYIACWEWGKYLGEEALAEGVDVCVSSWNRIAPNTLPALAKAGANYMNSQLIKMEADHQRLLGRHRAGRCRLRERRVGREYFCGARRQDSHAAAGGFRAAGHHPRLGIAAGAGPRQIPVVETIVPREMLYIADEVFFSGTAAEITPIRSIDRIPIGKGRRGPVAEQAAEGVFRDRERNQAGSACLAVAGRRAGAQFRGKEIKKQRNLSRPPPPRSTAQIALLLMNLSVVACRGLRR